MRGLRLARFADLVQVIVSLVTLAIAVDVYVSRGRATPTGEPRHLDIGSHFKEIPGVQFGRKAATLILFERSGCHYCTESMPFYRALSKLLDRKLTQFVAASYDAAATSRAYLGEHDVRPDIVAHLGPGDNYPVEGTPTLVLLDASGNVRGWWVGRLDESGERKVLDALHVVPSSP